MHTVPMIDLYGWCLHSETNLEKVASSWKGSLCILTLKGDTLVGNTIVPSLLLVIEDLPEALLTRSLVSNDQLAAIADQIQNQWEKLASKFTALDEDDLSYFKEKDTPLQQASNMLTVWKVSFVCIWAAFSARWVLARANMLLTVSSAV